VGRVGLRDAEVRQSHKTQVERLAVLTEHPDYAGRLLAIVSAEHDELSRVATVVHEVGKKRIHHLRQNSFVGRWRCCYEQISAFVHTTAQTDDCD
jgi:hypothetical protein